MTQKIVFFDIDGTLLDHNKMIPESAKNAVKKLKDEGVHVAIATGRAPFMFEDIRKELEIESFVSFNGQYVVYEGEVIYQNPLDPTTIAKLEEYANANNHPMVFLDHKAMKANTDNHEDIQKSMGSLKMDHPPFDPKYYHHNEIYQALLFCKSDEEVLYQNRYEDLHFIRWHEFSQDVLPLGGSKAKGIETFIAKLGIDRENVIAFGDATNDLEMLSFVGTGVAMGNALDEVKKVANIVTKPVDEDGIHHGLKMLGLLK